MSWYKGFNPDFTCNGKQYEENETAEEESAKLCSRGMHYYDSPFAVWDYYGPVNDKGEFNQFAEVEPLAESQTDGKGKYCTTKLKIGAKFTFPGFVKAGIDFLIEKTKCDVDSDLCSSGYSAKIGSSGDYAKIGSSGYSAKIGSSGDYAQIGSSGDYAQIGSSGYSAKIGSSGYSAKIGSSGYSAKIGSSGYSAKIGSSGYSAKIGSSGDYAQIGSSGDYAKIGSSGDYAKIGSSGYSAKIGSSGDYAQIGSSGDSAKIGSSGDYARVDSTGEDSVIMCAGPESIAKAKKGSWITLSEWKYDKEKGRRVPLCVKTEQVDGDRIKEDVFYKLENGEFVEE